MPPLCLVNLIELDPPRNGGTSRVALEVSRLLLDQARRGELDVVVAVGWRFAATFPSWVGAADASVLPCLDGKGPVLRALRPDVIVSPLFGPSPLHRVPELRPVPHVVSMPDAYALDRPDALEPEEGRRRRAIYEALTEVTRVVTLSEYSKRRLLHHLGLAPGAVAVVPPGVPPARPSSAHVPITGRFVLYPARDWAHKRHPFLLAVMDEVWKASPDVTLVLTGWHDGAPEAEPPTRRHRGRVVNLGYVPDSELQALYESAEALLFPSSFEGFGLPVLEAMAAGCPVVCSGLEVLRELVADAALVPPADEPAAWARAITEELPARSAALRASGRLRALDFSPERMRRGWGEQLRAAGVRFEGSTSRAAAAVPLSEVQAELTRWTDVACHADERLAVIARLQKAADERLAVIEDLRRSAPPAELMARLLRRLVRRLRRA